MRRGPQTTYQLVHCHLASGRLQQLQEQLLHWQQHPADLSAEPEDELNPASSPCPDSDCSQAVCCNASLCSACRVIAARPVREVAGAFGASVQVDPQDTELAVQELTQHHKQQ